MVRPEKALSSLGSASAQSDLGTSEEEGTRGQIIFVYTVC